MEIYPSGLIVCVQFGRAKLLIDIDEAILIDLKLQTHALRSLTVRNAGGKSAVSEAMSIQYFMDVHKGYDVILEMEVCYWIWYKMVDFIITMQSERVGVSVTRAMGYPAPEFFTLADAVRLLNKKIYGLIVSRNSVDDKHSFFKCVLHIWCQTQLIAQLLHFAFHHMIALDIEDMSIQLTICSDIRLYT